MKFLHGTTAGEIVGKTAMIILRANTETLETIKAEIFLSDGRLCIDCNLVVRRKYVVPVPDDAVITKSASVNEVFGVFLHPASEAAKYIKELLRLKLICLN